MAYTEKERLANLGYLAIVKETTKGTAPSTPGIYVPIYSEGIVFNQNDVMDSPIIGQKFGTYQVLPGMRSYSGPIEVMAEPNTVGYFMNMLLNKTGTSGTDPYTHAFALNTTDPVSYTMDIAKGNVVHRYFGVEASEISPSYDGNEMHLNVKVSALSSLIARRIASVSTVTLTMDTTFGASPTTGFIVGDLVTISDPTGAVDPLNTTVSSITNGTTLVLAGSAAAFAAVTNAQVTLRPATPSFTIRSPFLMSKTEFRISDTAANALSAAKTPAEDGSNWTLTHKFKDDAGEHRFGNPEPQSLVRTLGAASIKLKRFFDTAKDIDKFQNLTGQALVVRHFSEGSTYELRITFNSIYITDGPNPPMKSGEVLYTDLKIEPSYNPTDGQAVAVSVINKVSTV